MTQWSIAAIDEYDGVKMLRIISPERLVALVPSEHDGGETALKIAALPALLEALEALSEAVAPTREGKRDGGTFGRLSLADDVARTAIALARGTND